MCGNQRRRNPHMISPSRADLGQITQNRPQMGAIRASCNSLAGCPSNSIAAPLPRIPTVTRLSGPGYSSPCGGFSELPSVLLVKRPEKVPPVHARWSLEPLARRSAAPFPEIPGLAGTACFPRIAHTACSRFHVDPASLRSDRASRAVECSSRKALPGLVPISRRSSPRPRFRLPGYRGYLRWQFVCAEVPCRASDRPFPSSFSTFDTIDLAGWLTGCALSTSSFGTPEACAWRDLRRCPARKPAALRV